MIIKFEPSGTKIWNGKLQIRLDLYPEPCDKVYSRYLVTKDENDKPLAVPQLNPCLGQMVIVEPSITPFDLDTLVRNRFPKDDLALIDNLLLIDPIPRELCLRLLAKAGSALRTPTAKDIEDVKARLKDTVITGLSGLGQGDLPLDAVIAVGAGATDRASTGSAGHTSVDFNVPADGTGTIDTLEIFLNGTGNDVDVKMGVFYLVAATTYHCRTGYDLGAIAAGSKYSLGGISPGLAVTLADFIGCYTTSKAIERVATGGLGRRVILNTEACDTDDEANFSTSDAAAILSLYASGQTAGGLSMAVAMHHYKQQGVS